MHVFVISFPSYLVSDFFILLCVLVVALEVKLKYWLDRLFTLLVEAEAILCSNLLISF